MKPTVSRESEAKSVPCACCLAPVVFAVTEKGGRVALDAKPKATGNLLQEFRKQRPGSAPVVRRIRRGERFSVWSRFFTDHRETCRGAR
jgi:hypothetical protein